MIEAQGNIPDAPSLVPEAPVTPVNPGGVGQEVDAGVSVESGVGMFTSGTLFDQIQTFSTLAGVGVVVYVAYMIIRDFAAGAPGMAVRNGIIGAIMAAMLFNLRAPIAFAVGLTSFVESVFQFLVETLERVE